MVPNPVWPLSPEAEETPGTHIHRGKTVCRHSERASTLILSLRPPELREINCCLSYRVWGIYYSSLSWLIEVWTLTLTRLPSCPLYLGVWPLKSNMSKMERFIYTFVNLAPSRCSHLHWFQLQPSSFSHQKTHRSSMSPPFPPSPKSNMPGNPTSLIFKAYPDPRIPQPLCCYHPVQVTDTSALNSCSSLLPGLPASMLASYRHFHGSWRNPWCLPSFPRPTASNWGRPEAFHFSTIKLFLSSACLWVSVKHERWGLIPLL